MGAGWCHWMLIHIALTEQLYAVVTSEALGGWRPCCCLGRQGGAPGWRAVGMPPLPSPLSLSPLQGLMGMTPKGIKAPKAQLMATYYAKLTQIFTKSENRLYNAYAWYRWAQHSAAQLQSTAQHSMA